MEDDNYPRFDTLMRVIFKVLLPCLFFTSANSAPVSGFSNNKIPVIAGNNILNSPVLSRVTGFTGIIKNGEYEISWETVIEENIRQYDVEYSYNNVDFQRAGVVNANRSTSYKFSHVTSNKQYIYYRLRIVDISGKAEYSNTVTITNSLARGDDFTAPTIVRDGMLYIVLTNSYKDLMLVDSKGQTVYRENIGQRTGRISLALPELPMGAYFIRLVGSGGNAVTKKVMIQ